MDDWVPKLAITERLTWQLQSACTVDIIISDPVSIPTNTERSCTKCVQTNVENRSKRPQIAPKQTEFTSETQNQDSNRSITRRSAQKHVFRKLKIFRWRSIHQNRSIPNKISCWHGFQPNPGESERSGYRLCCWPSIWVFQFCSETFGSRVILQKDILRLRMDP